MQQSATSIRLSVQTVMSAIDGLRENTKAVKDFYAALDVKEYLREGEVPYPPKDDVESTRGMAINLRDVKYDYPGTHSTSSALKGISLDIQPGHLIVIVGANGSGKSTLIKLLTRLHDPTSGEISIDGIPASSYKVSDLRRATATFTQDHELFPLSLYENIGLGDCTRIRDEDAVMKAAEMGGAMDLISKLEEGADTILEPMMSVQSYLAAPIDDNHPIIKAMDELERETDISGGEKQRVVAARTFMHINSGNVKLVAVDEPSSALDPEAELSLFQHLIEAREGKTMIFVTHRFGHLTKFADMIVCMKEGEIAEQGSHKELIELDGEYAKLYNIQASAFTDTTQ